MREGVVRAVRGVEGRRREDKRGGEKRSEDKRGFLTKENEHSRDEIGHVRQVAAVESLFQSPHLHGNRGRQGTIKGEMRE